MESQFILTAALLITAGATSPLPAQLDLRPKEGVYVGEGTPFPCIRFSDGGGVVRFSPPKGWVFTADGERCAFHPKEVTQASGTFARAALSKDADPASPERLQKMLAEGVPAGATNLEFVLEGLPGVKLDHWLARRCEATYEHFGQTFRVALLIVPLEREELQIRFGCRTSDFDRVFPPFFDSLGTFTWNPTDEDRPTGSNSRAAAK
jgi:hypothetical protein